MNETFERGKVTPGMVRIIETIARRAVLGTGMPGEMDNYLECFGLRAVDIANLIEVKVKASDPAPAFPSTLTSEEWNQGAAKRETDACLDHAWYRLTPWERGFLMDIRERIKAGGTLTKAQLAKVDKIWRMRVYRYQHRPVS